MLHEESSILERTAVWSVILGLTNLMKSIDTFDVLRICSILTTYYFFEAKVRLFCRRFLIKKLFVGNLSTIWVSLVSLFWWKAICDVVRPSGQFVMGLTLVDSCCLSTCVWVWLWLLGVFSTGGVVISLSGIVTGWSIIVRWVGTDLRTY